MKNIIFLFALLAGQLNAQETAIREVVDHMFQAMYDRDTATLRTLFIPAADMYTYKYDSNGNPWAKGETLNDFIRGVSQIGDAEFHEYLQEWHIAVDEGVASVWTPYEFYFEGKFSHCGVNSFELLNVQGQWKISQITDTRRREKCVRADDEITLLHQIMDDWHRAAATANEDAFFGRMTDQCIYIGTDPTERWVRDELREWSKKYFDRESAWDFKPVERHIQIHPDGKTAWLDELLDTWMGKCRSSAMLIKWEGEWYLHYYHLSIAVPNDKVNDYLKLLQP